MKLERTIPYLLKGKRAYRLAWKYAKLEGFTDEMRYIRIDDEGYLLVDRKEDSTPKYTERFNPGIDDITISDWVIEHTDNNAKTGMMATVAKIFAPVYPAYDSPLPQPV